MKPNIVITCIDHTNNNKYINVLKYWLYKYSISNTEANVILLSDTKTDFSSFKKPLNIEHIKFDLNHDKDYQEIKKKYISCNNKWYDHNMVISDILRFGKMPSMFQNLLIIDLDAIVENAINISDDILLKPMAGCDHGGWKKNYLNAGFTYINTDIGPEFLNKVINSNFNYPWFCETLLSEIWANKYYSKLPQEYNWLVGLYGFNSRAYVNHYWKPIKGFKFDAKDMINQEVLKFIESTFDL
jgi:hypothetical protein